MSVLQRVRRVAQSFGVEISRFPGGDPAWRRSRLLRHHGITVVFDVGANDGRYVQELRRHGYDGRAVSFEPVRVAFERLQAVSLDDARWHALPWAVGATDTSVVVNVAGNRAASSSVLPMLPQHVGAAPASAYVGREDVVQRALDGVWRDFLEPGDRTFLKIDVQGYEEEVMKGAGELLGSCTGLQVEVSFVPLYEGAPTFMDVLSRATGHGLTLMSVEPGFSDAATGQMLQADFVFFRAAQQ